MTPSRSPCRRKSKTGIDGRLRSDAGAAVFNGGYVESVRSGAFGQKRTLSRIRRVLLQSGRLRSAAKAGTAPSRKSLLALFGSGIWGRRSVRWKQVSAATVSGPMLLALPTTPSRPTSSFAWSLCQLERRRAILRGWRLNVAVRRRYVSAKPFHTHPSKAISCYSPIRRVCCRPCSSPLPWCRPAVEAPRQVHPQPHPRLPPPSAPA